MAEERPPPKPVELTEDQRHRLLAAVSQWAATHPAPHRPLIGLATRREMLSPHDLQRELSGDTPTGRDFLHLVGLVLNEVPFEAYIRSIVLSSEWSSMYRWPPWRFRRPPGRGGEWG